MNQPTYPNPSPTVNPSVYSNPSPAMRYGQQPYSMASPYIGGPYGGAPCAVPPVDPVTSAFQMASGGQ